MTARRLIALVAAAVLVIGAFVVRRNVIDDDEPTTSDSPGPTEPNRGDATELVCITELRDVCNVLRDNDAEVRVTIEDAGITLDRLAALDDPTLAPLWLTIDPFPAMVDVLRRNEPLGYEAEALAASQLAIAFPNGGKAETITTYCTAESQPLWHCIGTNAGTSWSDLGGGSIPGTLNPSLGDVTDSALALASFGNAVASYFGEPDVSATRFVETAFTIWLRNLSSASEGRTQRGNTPLGTMAVRPALDAAATATYQVATIDESGDEFDVNYSEPQMWIQAVIATPAGIAAPDDLAAEIDPLLRAHGWEPPATAGDPPPSASTLIALRTQWSDYT